MFMRVNSKCAHQVRPPLGRIHGSAAVGQTLGDKAGPIREPANCCTDCRRHTDQPI